MPMLTGTQTPDSIQWLYMLSPLRVLLDLHNARCLAIETFLIAKKTNAFPNLIILI